jgi:hypothetical protein
MQNFSWDPLSDDGTMDAEIVSAAKKREIRNILKSYVGFYDPFSELIQNAMDAVDQRKKNSIEEEFEKKIWIRVDLRGNLFSITDNGIGFNESEFKTFLAPNISFKDGEDTRGNKGVGATYIAYGFNYLQIGTKTPKFSYIGELQNGRRWVDDNKGIITRPNVEESDLLHPPFETVERGSTFTIKFGGDNTRPKKLNWYGAATPEQWVYLLLIKTPLGSIDFFCEQKDRVKFDLTVINREGERLFITEKEAEYIFPHQKIKASVDLKEVMEHQKKLLINGRDASDLPQKFYKLNGIYEYFDTSELMTLPTKRIHQEQKELIETYKITAYGYFLYSTDIWDSFNDKIAKLRKGYRILKGGLQLANNYMPQGDLISIPLTSNIGYQNQAHVIVHFKNADPDLGRKGFQPELKELAEDIAVGIVNKLKKWRKLLKKNTGSSPSIEKEIELYNWIKKQEQHENENPLIVQNPNFFIPVNEISITSTPQSEQDVIVLFNQLIAGGVLRGIKLLATSQIKQYDGIIKFYMKAPFENYIFDSEKNPIGIEEKYANNDFSSPPKILEYKYNLDALVQEFENEEKKESEVDLVVVWELGEEWKKNYEITSLLDLENIHHRDFHGITHVIHSNNSHIKAIVLSELVDYLNNVQAVQKYQKQKYAGDIFQDE